MSGPAERAVGSPGLGTPARDALDGAITAIAAAGCETPRLDAELLAGWRTVPEWVFRE